MSAASFDLPDFLTDAPTVGGNVSSFPAVVPNGQIGTIGPIDVRGFTQLYLRLAANAIPTGCTWSYQFFADAASTLAVTGGVNINKNGANSTDLVVPVIGPWLRLSFTNSSGGGRTATATVIGIPSAATFKAPHVSGLWEPLDSPNTAVGAGATVVALPSVNMGGAGVLFGIGTRAWTVFLDRWNGTTWNRFAQIAAAANVAVSVAVNLPTDDWRANLADTSAGAQNIWAEVILAQ